MQFTIPGKTNRHKFWTWAFKVVQRKIKKTEPKTVNVISITFPSAFSLLIRYEIINTGQKYEIVLQGDFKKQFKEWKENQELDAHSVNAESIIIEHHKNSTQVTNKFKS